MFCHVTSRIEGEPYPKLLRQKGGTGFPTLAFLDADGDLLVKYSGARDVDGFSATGEKVRAYLELATHAQQGEQGADLDLFVAGITLGKFKLANARTKARAFQDLSAEQTKRLQGALLNLELIEGYRASYRDKEAAVRLGAQWFAMAKDDRLPTDPVAERYFWTLIERYGVSQGDIKAKRMAKAALKKASRRK